MSRRLVQPSGHMRSKGSFGSATLTTSCPPTLPHARIGSLGSALSHAAIDLLGFLARLAPELVREKTASPSTPSSPLGQDVFLIRLFVEMTGFEPATSWLQTRRSSS